MFEMLHFFLAIWLFLFPPPQPINYVALGDSYTQGELVQTNQRWTNLLVDDLKKHGVAVQLTNLGVGGNSISDVTEKELPRFTHADIITLEVGVNDIENPASEYQHKLSNLLDKLHAKILLLTIPDTLLSPYGKLYADPTMVKNQINTFNTIIKAEGKKRGIPVVDIYAVSLQATNSSYFADRLHPSAKQYVLWEKAIYPEFSKLIN